MDSETGMMEARGKHFVATQGTQALLTRTVGANRVTLRNGDTVDMLHYFTDSDLATGASDTTMIANSDTAVKIVVFAYAMMCDAATAVQFRSNSADASMKHYCAANGGIVRQFDGLPKVVCEPGQPLAINTSGGNTNLDLHYAIVPISADIL